MILKIFFFTLSFRYVCILYTKILAKKKVKNKTKRVFYQFLWLHKKHQFPCFVFFRDVLMSSEGHVQIACTPCGSSIKSKSRNTWRCPLFPNGKSRPSKRDRLLSSWVMAESKVFVFIWRVTGAFLSQSPGHSGKTLRGKKKGATRQRPWLLREGQQMSGKGGGVKGHLPSCPDWEVLTQEPEEVRRPMLPQAGMSPVLGRLCQCVVPHLKTHRDYVEARKPIT